MNWISDNPESHFSTHEDTHSEKAVAARWYHHRIHPQTIFPWPGGVYARSGEYLPNYATDPYRYHVL